MLLSSFIFFVRSNWLCLYCEVLYYTNAKLIHAGYFGSDHCQRAAGMLACQSYFPLCDECQSGHSYLASREDCERVSAVECEEEWTIARQYGIPLPNCTELPEELIGENHGDVVEASEIAHLHESLQENMHHAPLQVHAANS